MNTIEIATIDDVPAILELQRLAFGPQCKELGFEDAAPMTETLEHAYEEFTQCLMLKIQTADGQIIGSVRGSVKDGSLYIGRLMVHPDHRQKGLGQKLFLDIQSRLPHTRVWLCTCQQVTHTYEFYQRQGFKTYQSEEVGKGLTWVYMEKIIGGEASQKEDKDRK